MGEKVYISRDKTKFYIATKETLHIYTMHEPGKRSSITYDGEAPMRSRVDEEAWRREHLIATFQPKYTLETEWGVSK